MSARWGDEQRPVAVAGGVPVTVLLAMYVIAVCVLIAGALL